MHGVGFLNPRTNRECVSLIWPKCFKHAPALDLPAIIMCSSASESQQASHSSSPNCLFGMLSMYTVPYGPRRKGARKILSSFLFSLSMTTDKQAEARRRENTQKKSKSKSKHSRGGSNPNATAPTHCRYLLCPVPLPPCIPLLSERLRPCSLPFSPSTLKRTWSSFSANHAW